MSTDWYCAIERNLVSKRRSGLSQVKLAPWWCCRANWGTSTSTAVLNPGPQQVSPHCWKKIVPTILVDAGFHYPDLNCLLYSSLSNFLFSTVRILTLSKLTPCSSLSMCTCDTSLPDHTGLPLVFWEWSLKSSFHVSYIHCITIIRSNVVNWIYHFPFSNLSLGRTSSCWRVLVGL